VSAVEDIERTLRASLLFGGLDGAVLHALAAVAARRRLARGEALWRAGNSAAAFTVVGRGLVQVVQRTRDGGSSILAIFGPRESVGDVAALHQRPYPADAVALTTTLEVLSVPVGPVLDAARACPAVLGALNASLAMHAEILTQKIRVMSAGPVPRRLATLLLQLVDRFGDETEDGAVFVPVALARADLAHLVGSAVETTIRTMSEWQKRGLVRTTVHGLEVRDPATLRALATRDPPQAT
jgi:CRP-like cAMP-binding protein